jgi:phosphatidate phosphatase LPIN
MLTIEYNCNLCYGKVNVSVNGHPIPFNMKIGEAGEAFFVFETDEDVPPDLITSPILSHTESPDHADVSADGQYENSHVGSKNIKEPEFLDLNALPTPEHEEFKTAPLPPSPASSQHSSKKQLFISQPAQSLPSPPPTPSLAPTDASRSPVNPSSLLMNTQQHVYQTLQDMEPNVHPPEVRFSGSGFSAVSFN